MERYICIHGHFYQPPRENPWLEAVELQDSAYPYHDWNERVTAECYAPNSASRILDADNRIHRIVNNYSRISFNFGPTLLAWMEEQAPHLYRALRAADAESRRLYSGHGSAMAQAYNHMILPLASSRDKRTQVHWGVRDFQHRFGRAPEGMWLPETAVDLETLDILAEAGIQFTILSPYQARRSRRIGDRAWRDASGGGIDPSTAYRITLPSGRMLSLFFYDGPISRAVAFEELLARGENLADRLANAFSDARKLPQLIHIATDGESYGHHRRHGDMALAYALHYIEAQGLARLTNYGEFLERHPPAHEVEILENSSWSCSHGVERWRADCGCSTGMHRGWKQHWRRPLRESLDWLRDRLAGLYEEAAKELLRDPWAAREDYIGVILDRSPQNLDRFLGAHAARELTPSDRVTCAKLLELQRQAMLMYTSCGWFFDELSGIETVQIMQYAGRAIQLAQELFGDALEEGLLSRLAQAKSNLPELGDGRRVYEKFIRPAMVDLTKAGAHYAISSLFEDYPAATRIYCYTVQREEFRRLDQGKNRLALGHARITCEITQEAGALSFGILHLGDQNVSGGVRQFRGEEAYRELESELTGLFERGDIPELVRAVDRHFGTGTYSLTFLFRDQQRKVVNLILESATAEAAALYRSFYRDYATLARFVTELGIPLPQRFQMAIGLSLNEDLLQTLSADQPDADKVEAILAEVRRTGVELDAVTLEFAIRRTIERAARRFAAEPDNLELLRRLEAAVALCPALPFEVDLWEAQNAYYTAMQNHYQEFQNAGRRGDPGAQAWINAARSLGEELSVRGEWLTAENRE